MLRRTLSALSLLAVAGGAALVPSTASAAVHETLFVKDASVVFTSAKDSSAKIDYTCTTDTEITKVSTDFRLFAFRPDNVEVSAYGPDPGGDAPFYLTCDGSPHSDVVRFETHTGPFADGPARLTYTLGDQTTPTSVDVTISGVSATEAPDTRAKVAITTNATPERVNRGSTVTVKGKIKRNGHAYSDKVATLEFMPDGGSYAKVKTVRSSSKGNLKTKVKATVSGSFRYTSTETSKTRAGVSRGDHIVVNHIVR